MELKTTAFAMLMIIVISYRNKKIADLEGKKYRPYGIGDMVEFMPDLKYTVKKLKAFLMKKKVK